MFFLVWLLQFLKKKREIFSCLKLLFKHFYKIKIQSSMSEQEKKRKKSMIC